MTRKKPMDPKVKAETIAFWQQFKEQHPGLSRAELARLIGVFPADITRWCKAEQTITLRMVSRFIEADVFSPEELEQAADLIRLSLLQNGMTQESFYAIPSILARSKYYVGRGNTQNKPILALTPLTQGNPSFYTKIVDILTRVAEEQNQEEQNPVNKQPKEYHILHQSIPDIRAKGKLEDYYKHLSELHGVVSIACHVEGTTWLKEARDANIPIVLIHDNIERAALHEVRGVELHDDYRGVEGKAPAICRVSAIWEGTEGLEELVSHLIEDHGCTQLRVVMGHTTGFYHRRRKYYTILNTAKKHKVIIKPEHIHFVEHYSYKIGAKLAQAKLLQDEEAQAIICLDDAVAHGINELLVKDQNRTNLIVTGYDNTEVSQVSGFSSIRLRRGARATKAFEEIYYADLYDLSEYPHTEEMPTSFEKRCCPP